MSVHTETRLLAFYISSSDKSDQVSLGIKHLNELSKTFNKSIHTFQFGIWTVSLCFTGNLELLLGHSDLNKPESDKSLVLCVGPCFGTACSIYDYPDSPLSHIQDRFLRIELFQNSLTVLNDYGGTIPVFYSCRDAIHLSNIEPCVVAGTKANQNDINLYALGAFLHFTHFIWDETIFKHIFTQEPDTALQFTHQDGNISFQHSPLNSIHLKETRHHLNNHQVAYQLYELNEKLCRQLLGQFSHIVLPLSAGYDSRMIFSVLANDVTTKQQLKCFSYGGKDAIDVRVAKKLSESKQVFWESVDLPLMFLEEPYLKKNDLIFGHSTHLHCMYQLEFLSCIRSKLDTNTVLTSGFMTGVPAGQHIGIMEKKQNKSYVDIMDQFGQSHYWEFQEILSLSSLFPKDLSSYCEAQFKKAIQRVPPGCRPSIVLDLWTRQRNFISYYPRCMEWEYPCLSPHMTPEYLNFFLSLGDKHLTDRYAVEQMFIHHYPDEAKIPSNSNGVKALGSLIPSFILKNMYQDSRRFLDLQAIRQSGEKGFFPLSTFDKNSFIHSLLPFELKQNSMHDIFNAQSFFKAEHEYSRLILWQTLAFTLQRISQW